MLIKYLLSAAVISTATGQPQGSQLRGWQRRGLPASIDQHGMVQWRAKAGKCTLLDPSPPSTSWSTCVADADSSTPHCCIASRRKKGKATRRRNGKLQCQSEPTSCGQGPADDGLCDPTQGCPGDNQVCCSDGNPGSFCCIEEGSFDYLGRRHVENGCPLASSEIPSGFCAELAEPTSQPSISVQPSVKPSSSMMPSYKPSISFEPSISIMPTLPCVCMCPAFPTNSPTSSKNGKSSKKSGDRRRKKRPKDGLGGGRKKEKNGIREKTVIHVGKAMSPTPSTLFTQQSDVSHLFSPHLTATMSEISPQPSPSHFLTPRHSIMTSTYHANLRATMPSAEHTDEDDELFI